MKNTTEENKIAFSDLKPGDILLLSAKDDFVSTIISIFTNSKVTHTAIVAEDTDYMYECTAPEACCTPLCERHNRDIYVRRLSDSTLPLDPVVAYAKKYADDKQPYAYADMVFIGICILTKGCVPKLAVSHPNLIIDIVKVACYAVEKWINTKAHPGQLPMVCSQMAFNAYANAALTVDSGYKIHIDDEFEPVQNLLTMVLDKLHAQNSLSICMDEAESFDSLEDPYAVAEPLLEQLIAAYTKEQDNVCEKVQENQLSSKLFPYIIKFANNILTALGIDCKENAELIAETLLDMQGAFVTPDDLCFHAENLTSVGCIYRTE